MIIPNALIFFGGIFNFHRSFLSGHITRVGLLVLISSALPLAYCLFGRMRSPLKVIAALLNAALFAMCAYAFAGTVYALARMKMLGVWFYLLTAVVWCASLGVMFLKSKERQTQAALLMNVVLVLCGGFALYSRISFKWLPWMSAALFAVVVAITALNMWFLVAPLVKRR